MGFAVKQRQSETLKKKKLRVVNDDINMAELNKKVKKSNQKKILILSFVIGIIVVMVLTLIMRYTQITQLNSELKILNKDIESLRTKRDYLVMELEPYKATSRIENLAKINLGMDYPKTHQYTKIQSGFNELDIAKEETNNMGAFKSFFSALLGVFDKE